MAVQAKDLQGAQAEAAHPLQGGFAQPGQVPALWCCPRRTPCVQGLRPLRHRADSGEQRVVTLVWREDSLRAPGGS